MSRIARRPGRRRGPSSVRNACGCASSAIKHNGGFRRVRLRGMRGAAEQFLMAALDRNLKRMATLTALR
ncbi:MAG: hypothetical protein ACU0BF_02325 [Paracoccaceae bacterium]